MTQRARSRPQEARKNHPEYRGGPGRNFPADDSVVRLESACLHRLCRKEGKHQCARIPSILEAKQTTDAAHTSHPPPTADPVESPSQSQGTVPRGTYKSLPPPSISSATKTPIWGQLTSRNQQCRLQCPNLPLKSLEQRRDGDEIQRHMYQVRMDKYIRIQPMHYTSISPILIHSETQKPHTLTQIHLFRIERPHPIQRNSTHLQEPRESYRKHHRFRQQW
jgi:hypothetical protein